MPIPAWVPIAAEVGGSILNAFGASGAQRDAQRQSRDVQRSQERMGYQGMAQSDRQFGQNANMGRTSMLDNRALEAANVQGRMNRAPMADQAQYLLMQRLGVAPRDITRGTAAYQSAPDPRTAAASYRPGMGGVDTSGLQAAYQRLSDPSQVPGEYEAQDASQGQMEALRSAYARNLAREADPQKRAEIAKQIAYIDSLLGGDGTGETFTEMMPDNRSPQEQALEQVMRRAGIPMAVYGR